jgi:hypothetical protein
LWEVEEEVDEKKLFLKLSEAGPDMVLLFSS